MFHFQNPDALYDHEEKNAGDARAHGRLGDGEVGSGKQNP